MTASISIPSAIAPSDRLALDARAISKSYPIRSGQLSILRELSLSVAGGQSAAILGPSGCGKSTLLSVLGTLENPTGGELLIEGVNPFALPPDKLADFRNRKIGFVFQDHHLLPQLSVLENVLLPTLAGPLKTDARSRADALLERVGLKERREHRGAELSGGERQRAAIARALINAPTIVLADEPTGNLDRKTAETVAELLFEMPTQDGAALVLVTHSERLAERAHHRFELLDGALVAVA